MALIDDIQNLLGSTGGLDGTPKTVFGIDFGTTTSTMVFKVNPQSPPRTIDYPRIPRLQVGSSVPSLFLCDDNGKEYCCDLAAAESKRNQNTKALCPSIKTMLSQEEITVNGRKFLTAYIAIQEVKRFMEINNLGLENEMVFDQIERLVGGVPVMFDAELRGKLKRILEEATGVPVMLVSEPILAAVTNDFYARKQAERRGQPYRLVNTLVIDVGGGTTDIVVLIPNKNRTASNPYPYTTHSPDGLLKAGDDMDKIMQQLLLEKIRANPGKIARSNLKYFTDENHFLCRRLRLIARTFKEELSYKDSFQDNVALGDYGSTIIEVTRAEYEERIRPLITEIVDLAQSVLSRCKLGQEPDVDILLVGGASYTPLLTTLLEQRFPWLKGRIRQRFPEVAVAMGAAIYAEEPEIAESKIVFGYAVDTYTSDSKKKVLQVVIPSDAKLPKTNISDYETLAEGQLAVSFRVYEIYNTDSRRELAIEEGQAKEYTITHKFGRRVPKGTPVQLKTVLTPEGILTMTVSDHLVTGPGPTTKTFSMNDTAAR